MVLLIDFENVNYSGLEGLDLLTENDSITIFYSNKCPNIIRKHMNEIITSGCKFEICKLKNMRQNGLDFYIATCVGEVFANNRSECVGIVSADKGFDSVLDYWHMRLNNPKQLVKCSSVAKCMYTCVEDSPRRSAALTEYQKVSLKDEYDHYMARIELVDKITKLFENSEQKFLLKEIVGLVLDYKTPKERYVEALKKFGRQDGLCVYRVLKGNAV